MLPLNQVRDVTIQKIMMRKINMFEVHIFSLNYIGTVLIKGIHNNAAVLR